MTTVGAIPPSAQPDNQHAIHSSTSANPPAGATFSFAMQSARSRHAPAATQTASGHIPLNEQSSKNLGHDFHARALNVQAYRLQLIASNIANADTPNYKAVDIDVREALLQGRTNGAAANSPHGQDQTPAPLSAIPLRYHVPQQGSVDGNTVEMDAERAKFADSMVRYQFSLDRVSGHYKMMSELLNNLKD